jgi:hypothetical protein
MIEPNKYYARQMNGPVLSANGAALEEELTDAKAIENYIYRLSIDTAKETELENIGRIIGYLRPLVPEGFDSENVLLIGNLPLVQDEEIGLATVGSNIGGQLSTIQLSDTNYMSLGVYRKFLKAMAELKRYGVTLKSVDFIASTVSENYDIEWDEDTQDLIITFHDNIGFKNIWILTQLFYRIATEPQVLVVSDEGE